MAPGRGAVVLREWAPSDVDILHELVTGAHDSLRPWMSWAAGPYTRDDAAAFIARSAENRAAGEAYSYAITVAGTPVGTVGMERNEVPDALEIGYWLHPAHTGHGYATLAAQILVAEAFTLPRVGRVQIWHDAANTASAGVPRRLGFTEVARRSPPREPAFGGEIGVDVIWELTRPAP
ncbi:MAG TPA: GNAT family N-acetyltransferase [Actinophytocola sp.]|jgi:RimJ/RimL family protein N-acetyltransferase|nr:GNAT family N-acetyltransferase [Actinophytocola sp.]